MTDTIRAEIERFVSAWFLALDVHAPVEECYRLLTEDGLHMSFPDGQIRDLAQGDFYHGNQ